ncbi:MAG: (d)CMP kinase [Candidatus Latescibacterota bacterium]|jgi:cytidylate kinase
MGERGLTIAIDGVVGSGKTVTAQLVAAGLGYRHLDTGAMYRAVTLAAIRAGVAPEPGAELTGLLAGLEIELESQDRGGRVQLNGEDVTEAIRLPEISRRVGAYADLPLVRRDLVARQQRLGAGGGVVAEGRDIATVVFPGAELKVRMVADLATRARRRHGELAAKGLAVSLGEVAEDIRRRDDEDAARDYGAAGPPTDLVVLDTTDLTLEGQVERIIALARERGA